MDELSGTSSLALHSQSENQSRTDEKRKIRKQKDSKAIAELRDKIPDIDNIFDIHGRIGTGTFSTVMLATLKCEAPIPKERRRMFAVKHLIPTSHPIRVEKELKCLIEIGGADNVAGIDLCLRRRESVAFVMPYLPHDRFQDYFDKLEPKEVQNYMKNLLIALKRVHNFNVIHRDVKPSNFLYNRKLGKFMLVDFGLAQNVNRTEASSSSTTNNNTAKRKNSLNDSLEGGDTKRARDNENNAIPCNQKSQGSPFKMPLKQINEIITPKSSLVTLHGSTKQFDSPLTRHVKSAVLGASMTPRLQQKISKTNVSPTQPSSSASKATEGTSSLSRNKYNTNRNLSSSSTATKCYCYGKNQVCNICLVKREIPASRAGTPGYRPPEVLLKYTDQTTAVDLWAVGVIFISILSAVYPFFKAPDDFVALAEIVTIFGDEAIRRTAFALSRHVCMSHKCKPLDLKRLCVRLRNRFKTVRIKDATRKMSEACKNCQQFSIDCLCADSMYKTDTAEVDIFPLSTYDLLARLLEINPHKRITAEEALNHPFFSEKFV